jgi:uncharacterized ParB-like nuclease family protein
VTSVAIASINMDGGTQPRAAIDFDVVEEYALALATGAAFPPAVVYFDGSTYWLADGFHRTHAHKAAGRQSIECDVRQGTRRDAILFSVGANASHGMRRTNEDKRRAVLALLNDPEWAGWSDGEISRRCAVSQPFVSKLRPAPVTPNVMSDRAERTYINRYGSVSTMNTSAIGGRPTPDRSVFDSTGAGSRIAIEMPAFASDPAVSSAVSPPRPDVGRAAQFAEDLAHTAISAKVRALMAAFDELPRDGAEAARLFPVGHRHAVSLVDLRAAARWLAAFADEWAAIEQENVHVAAE